MIPRLDLLIADARSVSLNEDHDDDYGLSDSIFVAAANQANFEIQKYLVTENCEPFAEFEEIAVVADQEAYDVPSTIFADNLVYGIEFSPDGLPANYYPLKMAYWRGNAESGSPETYFLDGGKFYVDFVPPATGGKFRVRFEAQLERLDLRRGTIASRTIASQLITDIVLTSGTQDDDALSTCEYVCVVDRTGAILMRNVPIDSYDASTFTLTMSHTFEVGETAPVGAFIVAKPDCSTHSFLPNFMESFYTEFMKMRAYEAQSSIDLESAASPFVRMLAKLVDVYGLRVGKAGIPERREDCY